MRSFPLKTRNAHMNCLHQAPQQATRLELCFCTALAYSWLSFAFRFCSNGMAVRVSSSAQQGLGSCWHVSSLHNQLGRMSIWDLFLGRLMC